MAHPHGRTVPRRRGVRPWQLVLGMLVLVGALLGGRLWLQNSGALLPDHVVHEFGTLKMQDGLATATIPLTVQEAAVVTDINSSCMCTKARIVQAEKPSEWLGMSHEGIRKPIWVALRPEQPAYIEISVDPAAHGENGVGPFTRVVAITTSAGETFEFQVSGTIVL